MATKYPCNKILFSFKLISILITNKNQILFCFDTKYTTDHILLFEKAMPRNLPPYQIYHKHLTINYLYKLIETKKLLGCLKIVHFRTTKCHFRTLFGFDSQNFITFGRQNNQPLILR